MGLGYIWHIYSDLVAVHSLHSVLDFFEAEDARLGKARSGFTGKKGEHVDQRELDPRLVCSGDVTLTMR